MRRLAAILPVLIAGCATPPADQLPSPVQPVGFVSDPLVRGAPPDEDHLARAAACVDRGDEQAAIPHLQRHLAARPDAVMIRAYLAELLLRTDHPADARRQFERFTRQACGMTGPAGRHLTHAHTRLMEIAEASGDKFGEHLHRGVGLVLLVRRWDDEPPLDDGRLTESTLATAGRALREAERLKPADPRAAAYLAEVYGRLGQAGAARVAARRAEARLPDAGLADAEREALRKWE